MTSILAAIGTGIWYPTILGILVVVSAVVLFMGSVYVLLGTNVGARLGFLITFTSLMGFLMILSLLWLTTASPLESPKGRVSSWKVIENVSDLAKAKEVQAEFGFRAAYGSYAEVVADPEVHIAPTEHNSGGVPSPMRADILGAVKAASEKEFPGIPVVPIMVVGATDGRYLRSVGIPTYGVQGFFFDRDDIRFHGRDERMGIKSFYEGQEFLYYLVKRLATPNP